MKWVGGEGDGRTGEGGEVAVVVEALEEEGLEACLFLAFSRRALRARRMVWLRLLPTPSVLRRRMRTGRREGRGCALFRIREKVVFVGNIVPELFNFRGLKRDQGRRRRRKERIGGGERERKEMGRRLPICS